MRRVSSHSPHRAFRSLVGDGEADRARRTRELRERLETAAPIRCQDLEKRFGQVDERSAGCDQGVSLRPEDCVSGRPSGADGPARQLENGGRAVEEAQDAAHCAAEYEGRQDLSQAQIALER
jgi:hypothetical protein